ncbi:MAG: iron-containing redox enzyme family protein [Thaumarchaeota archaeon]|nr:iron-containing redox enzyme family protein [Nitrososphaerota archaeon]
MVTLKAQTKQSYVWSLIEEGRKRFPEQHPFMKLLYDGKLTLDQLKGWAINRYYFHSHIPEKEAAIAANCPPDVRQLWIEKLIEEAGEKGKPSHPDLWLRFCKDLGLSKEQVMKAEVLPAVRMAVDGYLNIARYRPWMVGVAGSLTEHLVPKRMEKMIETFKKHYPFVTEEGMTFFKEHMVADVEHGELTIDIVEKYSHAPEAQVQIREGYFYKIDMHRVILDAVYFEYVLKKQLKLPP